MKEKLLKIINHYGINNQIKKFNEEAFELQEAIITHELKKSVEYEISLTELIGTKEHITEEIADVMVIVEQFVHYYDIDPYKVGEIMDKKINRQIERLKNEK